MCEPVLIGQSEHTALVILHMSTRKRGLLQLVPAGFGSWEDLPLVAATGWTSKGRSEHVAGTGALTKETAESSLPFP